MRRLFCTALLLLCCAYGCIAADVVQTLPQKGKGSWEAYTVSAPESDQLEKKKENFQPIRFAVSAKEIDRVLKYCEKDEWESSPEEKKKDKEEYGFELKVEDYDRLCDERGKITLEKKLILLRKVLPAALKLHSERLSVDPVVGNLTIKEKDTHPYLPKCPKASIPKEHLNGISNADFMLYVGVAESSKAVQICSNSSNGRPTSALIRFVSEEIAATRHFIRLAAHEVAHALGFEIETMKKLGVIDEKGADNNKKVRLVKSKSVIDEIKKHYKCDDERDDIIRRLALENDGVESDPLHWERRIAKDELMSPYTDDLDITGAYYTALTLAIFDSMSFYKADFSMAESMRWGKDAGCKFLNGEGTEKNTIIQNHSEMFCRDVNLALQCTSDGFALGMCTGNMADEVISKIPLKYYDLKNLKKAENDLMDGYTFIKPTPKTSCENGDLAYMPGSVLGNMSRCLKGLNLELKEKNDLPVGDICAEVKCENEIVWVRYNGTDDWHKCIDGRIKVKEGSAFQSGEILCPNSTEVCHELKSTIDFNIVYYEDEEKKIKEEEEEEEKERQRKETEAAAVQKRMEDQRAKSVPPQVKQSHPPSSPIGKHPAGGVTGNQRGSSAVVNQEVVSPPLTAPELHLEKEKKNQDENGRHNKGLPHQQPPLKGQENPSAHTTRPEDNKMSISETSKQGSSKSTVVAVEDTSSIKKEDQKNITESTTADTASFTQNPSQNVKNGETSPIDEPIHSESAAHPVGENRDHTVSTGSNPINTTTTGDNTSGNAQTETPTKATEGQVTESEPASGTESTIDVKKNQNNSNNTNGNTINTTESSSEKNATNTPAPAPTPTQPQSNVSSSNSSSNNGTTSSEKVNTANVDAPATVKGPNDTQMGQVMNNVSVIVGGGADNSITASYQFPLLLLVCALVALASP